MNNYTYNLVITIMFGILTFAAIFIPLFFSIRSSNTTNNKLNEFIKIITGINYKTKNILDEIKNSNRKQIEDSLMDYQEKLKSILKKDTYFQTIDSLTQDTITGLSGSIDMNLNNIPLASLSPSSSASASLSASDDLLTTILNSEPLDTLINKKGKKNNDKRKNQ